MLGCKVLLLHTVGRRTGKERVAPLVHFEDGPDLVLIASNGGARTHPTWYLNHDGNTGGDGGGGAQEGASEGQEGDHGGEGEACGRRRWPAIADTPPIRKKTNRDIPVVILEPVRARET